MVQRMMDPLAPAGPAAATDVAVQHGLAPGLYALLSDNLLPHEGFAAAAAALARAGAPTLQLRVKAPLADVQRLALQREVAAALAGWGGLLVINDRADLAALLAAEAPELRVGLHLGQDDLPPHLARTIVGPRVLLGLSTHSLAQVAAAADAPVDYLGFGPIAPTSTKAQPDALVGVDGLAAAAALSAHPLVAIGGLGLVAAMACRRAGAHATAIAGALFMGDPALLEARARELVEALS